MTDAKRPRAGLVAHLSSPGAVANPDAPRDAARVLGDDVAAWDGPDCGLLGVATTPVEAGPRASSVAAVAVGTPAPADVSALLKGYAEQSLSGLLSGLPPEGDHAVALVDPGRGAVALACRGDAPLFYTFHSGVLYAATRPAALLAAGAPAEADNATIRRFIDTGEFGTGAATCYQGIARVPSGQAVLIAREDVANGAVTSGEQTDAAGSTPPRATPPPTTPPSTPPPSTPRAATAAQVSPGGEPGSADELSTVASVADSLTHDLWRFLHDVGVPPGDPSGYLRWAGSQPHQQPLPPAPTRELLMRMKNRIYGTFLSDTFAARPWTDTNAVIRGFEEFIKGRGGDADQFWRLYLTEQWARIVLEGEPEPAETPEKGPFDPNQGKRLQIMVDGQKWLRVPIRTELFAKGDDLNRAISTYVTGLVNAAQADSAHGALFARPWYLVTSEKIVAIAQGRSYFIWEIEPNWWARTLSRHVVRTPYGIGLGSPWTMQLALQEVGLLRILFASAVSLAGKALGKRGWFYQVAGPAVRAIDGPTEYSAYPANVSAKLAPAKPAKVSASLADALRAVLPPPAKDTLRGVVVIDANDIGRNVMGQASDRPDRFFEDVFGDNPLGQGNERTPLCVVAPAE